MSASKKKVLIWMTSMHPGGAERALIGLLYAFDYNNYQVDLFLNRHEGDFLDFIPNKVHLLPEEPHYKSLAEPMKYTLQRGQYGIVIGRLIAKIISGIRSGTKTKDAGISGDYSHKFTKLFMPDIQKDVEYDLAISFMTPHYFVAERVNAKKKAAWIHTDYSQIVFDKKSQLKMWDAYDYCVAVSENVAKTFAYEFPSLKNKIKVIENILPVDLIRSQAQESVDDFQDNIEFTLLSIGRFSYAKNFESIPEICKRIIEKGIPVKWYIIGYGSMENEIRAAITESKMEENVILLGKKSNPYPYIKRCDVYIQPSRYEGKAVTVREAQILGKPVIITDFPTAKSQLVDNVNGIILPMSTIECAEGIASLLSNRSRMRQLENNCKRADFSENAEINKIYEMVDGDDIKEYCF